MHTVRAIPVGEFIRTVRNCSEVERLEEECDRVAKRLRDRKLPYVDDQQRTGDSSSKRKKRILFGKSKHKSNVPASDGGVKTRIDSDLDNVPTLSLTYSNEFSLISSAIKKCLPILFDDTILHEALRSGQCQGAGRSAGVIGCSEKLEMSSYGLSTCSYVIAMAGKTLEFSYVSITVIDGSSRRRGDQCSWSKLEPIGLHPVKTCTSPTIRKIQELVHSEGSTYDHNHQVSLINRSGMLPSHMSALSQSQFISQMGMRSGVTHGSPSPPGSKSATPSPSSSTQEEDTDSHYKVAGEKRPSADIGKKPKNPKKKKKKDPNEPQKPVSAYALFFRDTQAAIKGQNPNATFGDVSKIVASMWDSLGEEQKQAYKRKTEAAKKEYLKALAAYRASLVSKSYTDQGETKNSQPNQPSKMILPKQSMYNLPPQSSSPYPGLASFLSPADLPSYRSHPHSLSRSLNAKSMLPSISASPPPPFQISPPIHQHMRHPSSSLLNQSLNMQQVPQPPILPSSIGLQSPMSSSPTGQQS
ncbi:TOX high mobility group box family member 2-like [Bufo bufo]|uniref:TOX high mobility group box family member 2-like n=1 Tax=Bufo bufo TaxID=8384 RepID=UPI001ABDCEB9|nr:TOX high mobility group box family member 2-like [Bufo bufo]